MPELVIGPALPAMSKRNPFDVVGVRDSATEAEIKKAFRTRSLQLHPDKGGSTEAMQELKEAYDQLKDPSRCRAARRDPMIRSKPIIITLEQLHAGDFIFAAVSICCSCV